jgi:hypothetical protein
VNTAALHPGALVGCKKLGRKFRARVTGRPAAGYVDVEPIDKGITYRRLKAREVTELIEPAAGGQLAIGGLG